VPRQELESLSNAQPTVINTVINEFGRARLLTFDRDLVTRGPTVEVAHEALLAEWQRLREWLDQSRADIRMQRVLGNAANEWLASGQEASFILRGTRLDQFEAWAATTDMALTQVEGDYLEASLAERRTREAAEEERLAREAAMERRSRNFLRALVGVFAVAAIVAVGLTIFAFNQQGIAQSEADQRATAEVVALEERQEALNQADARATQQAVAEAEAEARATQQAIAETEADARAVAEGQALEERDRAVEAEQDALVQASIGLASQSELESGGPAPERAVLLALEAVENYPYTWQAEKALGNAILKSRLRVVMPYDDRFQSVGWSADGSQILISGMEVISENPLQWINANARMLDATTGEELLRITDGEPNMARWSPDELSILAVNEQDVLVKVWDVGSGTARLTLDIEDIGAGLNTNPIGWQTWSPVGDRFLIYTVDGLVKIFDARTGETLQTLSGHEGLVHESIGISISSAQWSPRGDLVAVSSFGDNSVIVYQADTGKALYTIPGGFEDNLVILGSWSPSGDRFVTRGVGGAKVYDAATSRQLLNLSFPQTKCVQAIWSPDGSHILTLDGWESATVWDAESGQELVRITDIVYVLNVDWSPSGDYAAVAGADGFVHILDPITGQIVYKLAVTFGWANWLLFSPDSERILAVGDDNTINILDLTEATMSVPISSCDNLIGSAWSPDCQRVAFGAMCPPDYPVKIWDSMSGEELFEIRGDAGMPVSIAWSPSGDRIGITYDGLPGSMIWDAFSGKKLLTLTGHENEMWDLDWSPDGGRVATASEDKKVIVWDSTTGDDLITFSGHQYPVYSLAWSPDGSRMISTSNEGEAIIWEAATGKVLLQLFTEEFTSAVSDAKWTKDGQRVIVLSADGFVRIFDAESGKKLDQFLTPSASSITSFSLSPTEERVIIGGHDGAAKVWNIATGTEMLSYEVGGYVDPIYSPDGTRVLIGNTEGYWGKVQVFPTWDSLEELIEYAKGCCVVRELTPGEREVFGLPPREE
jgi:WD40 repeat protein